MTTYWQIAGLLALYELEGLLKTRFGSVGTQAILTGLKHDIVQQGLSGSAAVIYVQATQILYESAEPLYYTGRRS